MPSSSILVRGAASLVFSLQCSCVLAAAEPARAQTYCVFEDSYSTTKVYARPFVDVEVDVVFESGGETWRIPAFFDGGNTWRVRFAPPRAGDYDYIVTSTDPSNPDFRGSFNGGSSGESVRHLHVDSYSGENPLRRHGFLRVASDRRHFEHADGTPFFWLGDTWWKCLAKRMPFDEFAALTADRKAKGFSVVQIVCGAYPDEGLWEDRWENEGGKPYATRDLTQVNPRYFEFADRRIRHLCDQGIVPAIVGGWGRPDCDALALAGTEGMKRHWRYLVARYGAFPTVWIVGGEAAGPEWTKIALYVKSLDAYARPRTIHPSASARSSVTDESAIDFDMLQTGHGNFSAAVDALPKLAAARKRDPPMPVLIGEFCYEGHMQQAYDDAQRYVFFGSMLSGAAGVTYGAAGVWHASVPGDPGLNRVYDLTTWREGAALPGSRQLGDAKRWLEAYPWDRFESHPEWTEAGGFAAGISNRVRVIYQPRRGVYDWNGIEVNGLEVGVPYRASYYDPVRGVLHPSGCVMRLDPDSVVPRADGDLLLRDEFEASGLRWIDVGARTKRENGRIVCGKGTVTIVDASIDSDSMVSVKAGAEAEAGVILRYEDEQNYLVGLYSPLLHSIFLHERRNGEYGPRLGEVPVAELSPRFELSMVATGDLAALRLVDGARTYVTPPVRLASVSSGRSGVWMFRIGDRQEFDDFKVSNARLGVPPLARTQNVSWITGDTQRIASLPCPQDWALVLERVDP
jgi:hypothetical protein